jgi:hypothetical protein
LILRDSHVYWLRKEEGKLRNTKTAYYTNQLSAKSGRRSLAQTKSSLAVFVTVKGVLMPRRNYLLTIRDQSDKIKVWDALQHKYHLYAEISRTSHLALAIYLAGF